MNLINYIETLEHIIENEEIRSGKRFEIIGEDGKKEIVEISYRPSNFGLALTISYIVPGYGIPIEIRENKTLNYIRIFLKDSIIYPGFLPFGIDISGYILQDILLYDSSIKETVKYLRVLITKAYKYYNK